MTSNLQKLTRELGVDLKASSEVVAAFHNFMSVSWSKIKVLHQRSLLPVHFLGDSKRIVLQRPVAVDT
jgi:hypothetical protein